LDGGGCTEDGEGDPERAHAFAGGLHGTVDPVGGVVGVRCEEMPGAVPERGPAAALTVVMVLTTFTAVVALVAMF
jgi:hypothetical protein